MKATDFPAVKLLLTKARQLAGLDALLQEALPESLRGACHVLNLREDTLIIGADSAALATQLRFATPKILTAMAARAPVPIAHIKIRTIMPSHRPSTPRPRRELTSDTRMLLTQTAQSQPEGHLKNALLRLARLRKPSSH